MKKLMVTTALTGLMIGGALAQTNPPAERPATPPAATMTPSTPSPSMTQSTTTTTTTATVVSTQRADQLLASKFKGTNVLGPDDQKIGDVSDILFDKSGKIEAFIISVGGFLGMGAKEVALAPNQVTMMPGDGNDPNDMKVKVSMTKDQLTQHAAFERYNAPRTTTGSGTPATRPAPAR